MKKTTGNRKKNKFPGWLLQEKGFSLAQKIVTYLEDINSSE